VTARSDFWAEVWNFSGILHSETYTNVVDENATIDNVPRWFTGSKLNYAENLIEKGGDDEAIALYYKGKQNVLNVLIKYEIKASNFPEFAFEENLICVFVDFE